MHRRHSLAQTVTAWALALADGAAAESSGNFSPCLNESTTLNAPFENDCGAYSAAGLKHIELWFAKPRNQSWEPSRVASLLRQHGLTPVSACASGDSLGRQQGDIESHLQQEFEMCQALDIPRYIVFSSIGDKIEQDDYKVATGRFVKLAELAARYHVGIAFEFIARSALIGSLVTSLRVLREARQPNTGICLDTFHFFVAVSKFEDLDQHPSGRD
ncbi:MAG: sugar phosphate isomerase/epimerase [Acidobacteria bacterium]|nr:MAG: sugar phosphate isomerase/epimerase [Acidobacteriota bacterium]